MAPHMRSTCPARTQRRCAGSSATMLSTPAERRLAVAPAGHGPTVTARRPCASGPSSRASRSANGAASPHLLSPNTRRPTPEPELYYQDQPRELGRVRVAGCESVICSGHYASVGLVVGGVAAG